MYIKVIDGSAEPYSLWAFKKDNPNLSLPSRISDETLAEYGVFRTSTEEMPEHDSLLQKASLSAPLLIDGKWVQEWVISPLPSDEKAANIRSKRNGLLSDTDWWAVQDRTMTQAEIDYRQALRDITDQPTFPDSVVWPTEV